MAIKEQIVWEVSAQVGTRFFKEKLEELERSEVTALFIRASKDGGVTVYRKVEVKEPVHTYNGKVGRITQSLFGVGLFEHDGKSTLVDMRNVEVA